MSITAPNPSRSKHAIGLLIGLGLVAAACGSDGGVAFDDVTVGSATIVDEASIKFTEISPFATFGSAQGNFGEGAHGTFGIFGAGASSPPHTHSGAYYAVVLSGDMNNPFGTESAPPTLSPGSFWAVPADDEHVTACLTPESECRFFFHAAAAFDFTPLDALGEERSTDASAIPVGDLDFASLDPYDGAATMWGDADAGAFGMVVRLEAGAGTGQLAHRDAFSLVPITGDLSIATDDVSRSAPTGSLVEVEANTPHAVACDDGAECLFYLFAEAPLDIRT